MENKLIVRIAEGLGNQMFMYAHSYALSKKINYKLLIDNKSGYFKQKDIRSYQLHNFNISTDIADEYLLFNNHVKNFKRKFLIKIDKFKVRKKFLIEKKDKNIRILVKKVFLIYCTLKVIMNLKNILKNLKKI